jgi:hypothetical protein
MDEINLEDLGYKFLGTILTVQENGQIVSRFIKAINPRGQFVFIDLDLSNTAVAKTENETVWNTVQSSPLFRSQKLSSYASAYMDVPAVMILCNKHACVVSRDDEDCSGVPLETNYAMEETTEYSNEIIPVPYPIIRASEILSDPETALEATEQATHLLRKNDYDLHNQRCADTLKNIDQLKEQCHNFIDNFFLSRDVLLQQVEGQEELAGKEQLQVYLLQCMKVVSDLNPGIAHALKVLQNLNSDMKQNFCLE